jgi:ABC-type nitrate/sulfonate/bicarbonate transport system substrate-binding protein
MSTLWYTRCPVPTASGVAIDTGILGDAFAGGGIEVAPLLGSSLTEAHFDHRLPTLFREGGNVPALWARARGERTRLLGLVGVPEFQAVLTGPDSGIADVGDLAGRRLILPAHGGERVDFFLAMALRGFDSALRSAGLSLSDCELVSAPSSVPRLTDVGAEGFYGSSVRALDAGVGDAIYVKGSPGADVLLSSDLRVVVELSHVDDPWLQINNGTPRTLTVSEELLEAQPALVTRYVAALQQAARWAAEHPMETAETVAKDTGATLAGVTRGYGSAMHQHLTVELRPDWVAHLEDQKRFLIAHGFIAEDFSLRQWIDPVPLQAAAQLAIPTR